MDTLIVGAGFAGATCARVLAEGGVNVELVEARPHVGGNAYDYVDSAGLLVHRYGPHIFHTNSERVFAFLSRFTAWRAYEHRVRSVPDGGSGASYPFPINRQTLNALYGLSLDVEGAKAFLERVRMPRSAIRNSEDLVLDAVGDDLCRRFYAGYTRKQWGLELRDLAVGVAARIPVRHDDEDRYFTDRFQAMPDGGYTKLFEAMLDHPRITVRLSRRFDPAAWQRGERRLIYTGPIDAFYGHCEGRLPYRSLRFEHEHLPHVNWLQEVGTVNFPNDHAYTRITEFKHLTGQLRAGTSIVREYPLAEGEPYYPIPSPANEAMFRRYAERAEAESGVHFIGRLAQYRYYNMDQVVAASLSLCARLLARAVESMAA